MRSEIVQAIIELKQAEQNFQYADKEFIEIAILQIAVAEMKVNTLLNLRKQNGPTGMDPQVREKSLTKIFNLIIPQQEQTVNRKIQVNIVNCMNNSEKHLMAIGKNF